LLNGGEENHAVVSGVENGGRRKSIEYTSFGHCKEACIDDDHDDYHETQLVYLMYLCNVILRIIQTSQECEKCLGLADLESQRAL
jgi:hypothetical protein